MTDTEMLLRAAMADEAEMIDEFDDPWPRFARQERAHRRNRRVRLAAAAAVLVAAVGVQTGTVPLPGWVPGIAIAGRSTALTSAPTRGSLAGDTAFLDGLRREIKDVQDPGELWKITDRSKIKFVYAADVAGHRLALALVPLRFGFLSDQALIWYEGKAGAAPAEMAENGREDGGVTVSMEMLGSADAEGFVVVVAPPDASIAVSSGFSYTPAGRVKHNPPVVATGIAEVPLPRSPIEPGTTVTVTSDGSTLFQGAATGGWAGQSGGDPQEPTDAMVSKALGDRAFDPASLKQWLGWMLHDARVPAAGTTVALHWTGTVDGQPAALLTLRRQGSGVIAYAMHGDATTWRTDLRLLLPAAGADTRPIAWRMRAEGKDDRTDQVIVVAPRGTARATLTVAGAAPVPLTLDPSGSAVTTLAPDAVATVTAYPAGGGAPASTPVTPFETDGGGIPGDTPKTRVVN